MEKKSERIICSFCGKNHHEVARMVCGPWGVFACDECIDLMHEIVHDGDGVNLTEDARIERAVTRINDALERLRGRLS